MLLLMVSYGLRAREVSVLTLDDTDWKRDRLHVRERKADHTTAYPLARVVGEAIIDYLKNGCPVSARPRALLATRRPSCAFDPGSGLLRRQQIPASRGHSRGPPRFPYAPARLRPTAGGCRLPAQDRRRLCGPSLPVIHDDLRQGAGRHIARSRALSMPMQVNKNSALAGVFAEIRAGKDRFNARSRRSVEAGSRPLLRFADVSTNACFGRSIRV